MAATPATDPNWTVVARFANAAEAGYFANELDYALGVEPRLDCCDDFDAIHHHWRSGFALSVPTRLGDRARATLQELLSSDPADVTRECSSDAPATPYCFERELEADAVRGPGSQIKWAPLLLTLAAGSLVMWHGKKQAPPRPRPDPRDGQRAPLRDAPGLSDSVWVQSPGGGVRRELLFPAGGGPAQLREDRDGDGVFERKYSLSIEE